MNATSLFFAKLDACQIDYVRREELDKKRDPKTCFMIAFTPRSGSSYLCDLLASARCFGRPDEYLNSIFMPEILQKIPATTPQEYLRNVFRATGTPNGVAGLKASWFQFENFSTLIQAQASLANLRFIYLTRRDTAAQAVSLYLATESNVFHTNVSHEQSELSRLDEVTYSFAGVKKWHQHILTQERGWREYFLTNKIIPIYITYEELVADTADVLRRIADYLDVSLEGVQLSNKSIFKKLGDRRNGEWAARFKSEVGRANRG